MLYCINSGTLWQKISQAYVYHFDVPSRWTALCLVLIDRATKNQIRFQGHYKWGTRDIRSLYLDLDAVDGDHPLKFCDLQNTTTTTHLVRNSTHTDSQLVEATKLVTTYDLVARWGGDKIHEVHWLESKLRHCLAAADFVADPKDVAVLQTEKDTDKL